MNYNVRQRVSFFMSTSLLFSLTILLSGGCGSKNTEPLLCYVGGTMRPAIEEVADVYYKKTGQKINIDYSDSGQLLIKIETTQRGDIYICHDPFWGALMKKGFSQETWVIGTLKPTIAVPKGNPKNIHGIKDLAQPGLRVGLTDEFYSTCGHIDKIIFKKSGMEESIEKNVVTRTRTGSQIANAVSIGAIDAAIVWNAVIQLRLDKLAPVEIEPEFLPTPKVDAVTTATFGVIDMSNIRVTLSTLKCSKQLGKAKAFAEFVVSPDGQEIFKKYGFSPASSSEENEELYLYCAAGLRPVVSEIINSFTAETGEKILCDYSGSGVLLSRIKLAQRGDLFIPGDFYYIDQLEKDGLISSKKMVCSFIPVILVKKGNPKGIHTLFDLVSPGINLGLGNPETCSIGQKSFEIFEKNGISKKRFGKNLAFSSMTVNELGIQITTGKLDAAIVWDAIAAYYAENADIVVIPQEQNIISKVGIGILNFTKNQNQAQNFVDFITSEKGKSIFQKCHYTIEVQD